MFKQLYTGGYWIVLVLFAACGLALIPLAVASLWQGVSQLGDSPHQRFTAVLEAIGILTVSVASLELSQTILQEEVQRHVHVSAPTRVRRFLSRFLVVVVVALSIETLIMVFEFVDGRQERLGSAAMVGVAVASILIGWGVFVRMNVEAERLEPEAMQQAKQEDRQVD